MKLAPLVLTAGLLAAGAFSNAATASPIQGVSGSAAPTIAGQTAVITFDDQSDTSFASKTIGSVTFSGIGGLLRTSSAYAGYYNGRGAYYLDNDAGNTTGIRFDFATPVSAFAFNWGASDQAWTLSAFDAMGSLLESMTTPITQGSNAGDFIGIQTANIAWATLTTRSGGDWVFVDNLAIAQAATAAVPEPSTYALLALGGMLVFTMTRRRRKAVQR